MLGSILIGSGLSLLVYGGSVEIPNYIEAYKARQAKANDERKEQHKERSQEYMKLFEALGIVKQGQEAYVVDYTKHKNFIRIIFELSTNLSTSPFIKAEDDIRQKLGVSNLSIEEAKGIMSFTIREEEIPRLPYKYRKTYEYLVPVGVDLEDRIVYWNLKDDPHLMLIGMTGSGKSRMLNSLIDHLIHNNKPNLYLIDLKRGMELGLYYELPNCKGHASTLPEVRKLLDKFEAEAEKRYKWLIEKGYTDFNEYVADHPDEKCNRAILIVDEFADITRGNKEMVDRIIDLACKVRAVGMTILLAAQRPTADFINPGLKANISGIIGMKSNNSHNSNMTIERNGCERLKPGQAITRLSGEERFVRGFEFNRDITKATIKKYAKKQQEQAEQQADPKEFIKK